MDLLMMAVDADMETISGNTCRIILRNALRPSVIESPIIGKTKETKISTTKIPAFEAISFFLSAGFIV